MPSVVLRQQNKLQLPAQIPVVLALSFQLKFALIFALLLLPSLLLNTRIGLVPPKHLLELVADRVRSGVMAGTICPKFPPGQPC